MRIYEIAREAGVTSVEVLKAAEAAGMEATSAISSVDADEAAALKVAVSKDAGGGRLAKRAEKRNLAAELNAKFFAEQRAKLEKHLAIAKAAAEGRPMPVASAPPLRHVVHGADADRGHHRVNLYSGGQPGAANGAEAADLPHRGGRGL